MPLSNDLLQLLHRVHTQLADLRNRLDRGPRRVQIHLRNVQQMEAQLAEAQNAVKQTKLTSDRKQLDLKANEAKVLELKNKLNAAASNKEYQALVDQIAATEMAGSVLADEILEAMEKTDTLQTAVGEAEKNVAAGRTELAKTRDAVAAESSVVQGDVTRLELELADAEKKLPADIRADYNRVVKSKGAEAMAPMAGGVCEGCGQKITLQMENDLRMEKAVFCKSCGRLLYLGE